MTPGEGLERPGVPRLHVVTDDRMLGRDDWTAAALDVLAAGGERLALHVRGPGHPGRRLYEWVETLLAPARAAGAALVVNGRVDVALVLPVRGVQLGERALPVREARRLLGPGPWVGASVHGPARAREAEQEGADYVVVGTVFATRSHPERPGGGLGLLGRTREASRLPVLAIGGITPERVAAVRGAGAHGVAVLGGVWNARDPAGAVGVYLEALEG